MKRKIILLSFLIGLFSTNMMSQEVTATYSEVINKQKKGNIDKYILESGESFSIGDTLTLGIAFRNENYEFIFQNAGIAFYPLSNYVSGSKVIVKRMKIDILKTVNVYTTPPKGAVYGLLIMNFDNAVKNGEIKSKVMTSDEALSELKKWKDKLDLQLITEEEYNQKKTELIKFIK